MKVRHRALAAAAISGLVAGLGFACGGESGNPTASTPDGGRIVAHDPNDPNYLPPVVVSRTPVDGDGQVSVRAPIEVKFSKQVQLGAVPATVLVGDTPIAVASTLSSNKFTLRITPVESIVAPATVTVNLGDISDFQGRGLEPKPSWSWTVPLWLSASETLNAMPYLGGALAPGAGGNTYAAVIGAAGVTVFTVHSASRRWTKLGDTMPIGPGRFGLHSQVALAVGKDGAPLIARVEPNLGIRVRRWSGATWNDLGDAFGGARAGEQLFAFTVDALGRPLLAYTPYSASRTDIFVQVFENGAWSMLGNGTLNDPSEFATSPSIALDKSGVPYIFFASNNGSPTRVNRARFLSGGTWKTLGSPFQVITGSAGRGNLTFDDAGNLFSMVTFEDTDGKSHNQLFGFDGKDWAPIGAELPLGSTLLCFVRREHLLAFVRAPEGSPAKLRILDITRSGWTSSDVPPTASTGQNSMCDVDADGTPVMASTPAWNQNGTVSLQRLNW
ncbi:Ig-like domain-containing protein [Pendulispora albinea]|uniref:Ig-like domain-containing protein n=1 Tax=Pendulispora albinea TaxID=2741071 RepID=A0ABZ2LN52_9BACT